ncbi:50S ribosomal protein L21 [Candidatus Kaiserbacteria bacterium CG10_big_fil_rev_8_21_14_0_10_59_10]|uniref:Large ribosomal subunit protein bL21 n=1 Tax=Candidatus Kaiserbacteria bacterium CG10_big_fil_rev_8_21_14_0_10_59_10 TaxID=1974612 RepID=A0A2H0U725_9BACT|nr:MAG: 50S ribosomal protein L21 [Candidatus Kaiserbacteria bacterium CG10_big_fil_rev_8_21_14_0_10_59_10]
MAKIAVIETGGKQYVVMTDSIVTIEKLAEGEPGTKVTFDKVLLTDDGAKTAVGAPYIAGAVVTGELVAENKAKKVTVIRYRQKSRSFKKKGHRQTQAKVRITKLP